MLVCGLHPVSGLNQWRKLGAWSYYTAVLTVRDSSNSDTNTKKLFATLAEYSNAKASIRKLDLARLSSVHDFASTIATEITDGRLPPLTSIICNAYYWIWCVARKPLKMDMRRASR